MDGSQQTQSQDQRGEPFHAAPCSAFHAAWADHCGLEPEDERAIYGWPKDRDIFLAGWTANESEARRLLAEIVAQYDAAPDGPLGKGFKNGPFLHARKFLSPPNANVDAQIPAPTKPESITD